MNSHIRAIMAAQGGLITRPQALAAGMSSEHIARLRRSGSWVGIRVGVYADAELAASARSHRAQRMLIDRAASLRMKEPHVMSHHSAAYRLGMDVLREPAPTTHLTRPGLVGTHHRAGIQTHLAPYDEYQVVDVQGIACLGAARTAADIARQHGFIQGLVAADSAYRIGATPLEFDRVLARMSSWPGARTVRDVIVSASTESDSVGETLARDLIGSLGFGVPTVQFGLSANGRTVWCDLCLGRHVFEFDGELKYRRADEGGFASSDPDEVVWFEKKRQDFICWFKLGVSRLVWSDVFGPGRALARERLRREYLDTCARFGTDRSDLAEFRPRTVRRRPSAPGIRAA
ncbi:hypothetical protein GCM10028801_20250 [Nocardioides maradonensis]